MQIAILIFDRITALDAIGPYEVLSRLPNAHVRFVGKRKGTVRTDNGMLGLSVDESIDAMGASDLLLVPGGFGVRALEHDPEVVAWVRRIHESSQWTTSVCTGSLLLGAAGLLEGLEATTHWACTRELERYGARYVARRVVMKGKIATAAGVSAGIDLALTLAARISGQSVAEAIQLGIEYDPEPPFTAGSPRTAPEPIVNAVMAAVRRRLDDVASSR